MWSPTDRPHSDGWPTSVRRLVPTSWYTCMCLIFVLNYGAPGHIELLNWEVNNTIKYYMLHVGTYLILDYVLHALYSSLLHYVHVPLPSELHFAFAAFYSSAALNSAARDLPRKVNNCCWQIQLDRTFLGWLDFLKLVTPVKFLSKCITDFESDIKMLISGGGWHL